MSSIKSQIAALIKSSLNAITQDASLSAFVSSHRCGPGDHIAMTNSHIHRGEVRTTKSALMLAIRIKNDGNIQDAPLVVGGIKTNTDFRKIAGSASHIEPLGTALDQQFIDLGELLFVLIGSVVDDVELEQEVSSVQVKKLILKPSLGSVANLSGTTLEVQRTYDEDAIWAYVESTISGLSSEEKKILRRNIGQAVDKLEDAAYSRLNIPGRKAIVVGGLLSEVVHSLRTQLTAYSNALSICLGDPANGQAEFNVLLRISYSFASDATTLLDLIVSICDLKPIVQWCTVGEHFALSKAMHSLPWVRSRHKPSVKNWQLTIGDARNEAFHNVFPLNKAIDIQVGSNVLENISLRMFSKYAGHKKQNRLSFKDEELVNVLLQFTRAGSRHIPPSFWRQNELVMSRIVDVFESTDKALKLLRQY